MAGGAIPPGGRGGGEDSLLSACPLPELLLGMCPYAVLGIVPSVFPASSDSASSSLASSTSFFASVTVKAIGTAYRRAALRAHPDKNKGREAEAAQEFLRIQAAFSFLSCQDTRSSYHGYLEKKERHEKLLAERRSRHSQADEKKRKLAEELQRKEDAFFASQQKKTSWSFSYDNRGGGGGEGSGRFEGRKDEADQERLRRIRERNEKLLEEHREQCRTAKSNVYKTMQQRQRESNVQTEPCGEGTAAAPVFPRIDEEEEDFDDLLRRSVYVHWTNSAETAATAAAAGGGGGGGGDVCGSSAGNARPTISRDSIIHPNNSEQIHNGDPSSSPPSRQHSSSCSSSPVPDSFTPPSVTPDVLSSLFTPLHALFIYGFTSSSALVAFATRERAVQSALEFQRQQKALRKSCQGLPGLASHREEGKKTVVEERERRESQGTCVEATDGEEEEEAKKKKKKRPLRFRVKLADQVRDLKERLRSLEEGTSDAAAVGDFARVLHSSSSTSGEGPRRTSDSPLPHRWRPFADSNVAPPTSVDSRKGQLLSSSSPPTNTTADPPRSSHTLASPRHLFPLRPRDLLPAGRRVNLPSQTEAGAAMTLAEFEAATFQHLREVAAKKKTLQQTATPHRQPPAEVIVLDGDG